MNTRHTHIQHTQRHARLIQRTNRRHFVREQKSIFFFRAKLKRLKMIAAHVRTDSQHFFPSSILLRQSSDCMCVCVSVTFQIADGKNKSSFVARKLTKLRKCIDTHWIVNDAFASSSIHTFLLLSRLFPLCTLSLIRLFCRRGVCAVHILSHTHITFSCSCARHTPIGLSLSTLSHTPH